MESEAIVVLVTVPVGGAGPRIARSLVEQGLAGCVNRIPGIVSTYRWEGELKEDREELLLIKTWAGRRSELEAAVLAAHPYDCPEFLVLEVGSGSTAYLSWLLRSSGRASETRES